ncbi:MAG: hypothetical protein AMJ46_03960 [Latescibacteria bacterium DG_63]|nr:MAG: hypothetical protein AMJ46_03960 [Latescibacteria bacterium DG_63]
MSRVAGGRRCISILPGIAVVRTVGWDTGYRLRKPVAHRGLRPLYTDQELWSASQKLSNVWGAPQSQLGEYSSDNLLYDELTKEALRFAVQVLYTHFSVPARSTCLPREIRA